MTFSPTLEADLAELESLAESPARDLALRAVSGVLQLHATGLARITELAPDVVDRLLTDDLVASLLLLHNLHRVPVMARVESALQTVRPYLASHGGSVDLLDVTDGVAHVRLRGTCHGCPSSTATLKSAIEKAVFQAAPDGIGVEAEGAATVIWLDSLVCPVP